MAGTCDEKAGQVAKNIPSSKVPYEFSMTATVKCYHRVSSVTSNNVKLNVTFEEDNKKAKVGEKFQFCKNKFTLNLLPVNGLKPN